MRRGELRVVKGNKGRRTRGSEGKWGEKKGSGESEK